MGWTVYDALGRAKTVPNPTITPAWPDGLQNGVIAAGDCALTVNSTTQITTAVGTVWVNSGGGVLTRTSPAVTVIGSIPAASASNFRLDQIVVNASGNVSRIAGTQGTTVTLANRTGAGAIPAGSLLLHDLLVSSSGVVNSSTTYRDRRPWARGYNYQQGYAGSNLTTTSSTFANMSASLSQRAELVSGNVLIQLRIAWLDIPAAGCDINFLDNGNAIINNLGRHTQSTTAFLLSYLGSGFSAGSHLFAPQWAVASAGQTATVQSAFGVEFTVREIVAQNANNGTV